MSREAIQLSEWGRGRETSKFLTVYRYGSKKDWYGKELKYTFRIEISKVGELSQLEIIDREERTREFKESERLEELLNEMERRIYEINKL